MQSIKPATSPPAVTSVTVTPPVVTAASTVVASPDGKPALPAARAARQSADVAVLGKNSYAVFSVDQESRATRIAIYDGDGRLVRMIPAEGVSEMLTQLAAYRRLG